MQFTTILPMVMLAIGVSAQYTGPNGARYCAGGAISCEYAKGRCANVCNGSAAAGTDNNPAFIDTDCSCPAGQSDNAYTGASCINVLTALGRQGC